METGQWVAIGEPSSEQDAKFLRDLIHEKGYPARIDRAPAPLSGEPSPGWRVLVRIEHEEIAINIRDDHFTGPTRRPTKRWRLAALLRRRRPAA